ncbi:MAG: sigma-54-dependent transcriptional regulator [Minwuia sp.]|uniref:nitrogen assimilation response regulator NtrX n=1 Tax=Minwuia sp. TaxID=2493630 RepID=UPI003A87B270
MALDVLIVDDEADIRTMVSGILSDEGYETRTAGDSDSALAAVADRAPALLILDIWLQGSRLDGLELLDVMSERLPDIPIVMISGHGTIETAVAAIQRGAYDFIEKPFQTDRLVLIVQRALETARLRRENAELRLRAGGEAALIGASNAIGNLRSQIEKVAPTNSRVLISGPPGSGKEVVARRIHALSKRSGGPFVVVNSATIEPARMELELFGEEPPSEGHIQSRKIGLLEQAHGGTLYLDEVADMPVQTQNKILRVLLDQTFERVGGARPVHVDVRVLSSSSSELQTEVAEGRFRSDLYHRLNVVPIETPPLRAMREDIPALVRYFIQRSADAAGLPARIIDEAALTTLQTHDWPGNARQLKNVIEQLLIMAPGDSKTPISIEMLPSELTGAGPASLRPETGQEIMSLPLREAREIFEREYLLSQIERFGGNVTKTAAFVGMERSALHRKLKLLGVGPERSR